MKIIKLFWDAWKKFAFKFGEFMSGVILTLFYFLIVTPHALLFKFFGDPLRIKDTSKKSEWQSKKQSAQKLEDFSKQY